MGQSQKMNMNSQMTCFFRITVVLTRNILYQNHDVIKGATILSTETNYLLRKYIQF